MKTLRLLGLGIAVAAVAYAAPPLDVQLVIEGESLEPSSTIEARFARPMVAREQVGVAAADSPLVFDPPLPGRFTWLSTRSGVYAPSAAPRLGTSFRVKVRGDLRDASGAAIGADFAQALKTPAFQISAVRGESGPNARADPLHEISLAFNLEVQLAGAEKLFTYVSDDGRKIAAKLRYGTTQDYFPVPAAAEDWNERWRLAHQPPNDTKQRGDGDEAAARRPNRLVITPAEPLPPGPHWRLEIQPGLVAREGGFTVADARSVWVGRVEAFTLKTLEAASYLNSGRSVTLEFSEELAPDVTDETAARFFKITPEPPNLRFEQGWQALVIRGDFARGADYQLTIDPSLLAASGQPLSGDHARTFGFEPVKPRLYLPEITADQLRSGARKFPIRTVNLKSVRITAQLVPPEAAARAIKAFEKYTKDEEDQRAPLEFHQPIPAGLIKGAPLAERVIELPESALDARQEATVDWTEMLGGQKAGLIFLTVAGQPLAAAGEGQRAPAAQALIQLTDLGVLWKKTSGALQATVFSMATGQAMEGAGVTLASDTFTALASTQTDAEGTASLPLKPKIGWLVVRLGDDVHALRMGEAASELPMSRFGLPIYYRGWEAEEAAPAPLRGLVFTDRPLYRPGEIVRVKGIVRRVDEAGVKLEAPHAGVLTLTYPREGGSAQTDVALDARGGFDASFTLPPGKVGQFGVSVAFTDGAEATNRGTFGASFQVQDFQPNAFETRLAMAERFAPAQPVTATASASYLFGAPVSDARVQWSLEYAPSSFTPAGFTGFSFGEDGRTDRKSLTLRGEGKLANSLSIAPQLPAPEGGPFHGQLTVEVTDQNQQTVAESRGFTRDASEFYLGLVQSDRYVIGHGEEITASAIAVRPDGTPMPAPIALKAELIRVEHETVRVQGAGKAVSFHTETREKVIAQSDGATLLPRREGDVWKAPAGETARFKPGAAGEYRLRLSARDSAGREVRASSTFTVSGRDAIAWDYRNPAQVDLVTDKAAYQPGETARVLVKTPISGEAWVSIERGEKVLRSHRVKLEGNAPTIEIPLTAEDAPNVFVSIALVRGAEQSTRKFKTADYRYGVCQLHVADPMTRLAVSVTPALPDAQPGQEIETEVRVLDAKGAPVADAEVAFFAVDDGILALTGYERPHPGRVFEEPFSLHVRTGLTLFDLFPEDPSDLTFANKGYLIGGGGGSGPTPKLRRDFPGTACWFPALRTDGEGRVKPRFTAPDALTRYRLVAVVHAGANRFGSGESGVAIRQPLMLLSALGPVANVGDEIIARAVVRNDTGGDGTAEITLALDATAQAAGRPLTTQLVLKNGAIATVDFPVKLVAIGKAQWQWSAHMAVKGETFDDRLAATIEVGSPVPSLRETYLTELEEKTTDLLAGVNPQLLEGEGAVAVTLSNTRLATLRESATQLLEYPYGCAEQLTSALVPWLVVQTLGPVLPDLGKDAEQVRTTLAAGVEKVFALQTEAGGLAYWPGGREPSLFASAWAAVVLGELAKRDLPLPPGLEKLLDYLSAELRGIDARRDGAALEDAALALFALAGAGRPEPAYHEKLATRRSEMTQESRALLALAIMEAKGPRALVGALMKPRQPTAESASWFGSATRERAAELMAWSRHMPTALEVGRLTKELLASRANGRWRTTQENAWALLALSRYFAQVEREVKPVSGTLTHNAVESPFALTKKQLSETTRIAFDPAHPPSVLSAAKTSSAPLYGETRFVVRPPVAAQPRQDRGYAVSRSYRKVAADGSLGDAADLRVGDRVVVTLRIETTLPGHFVAIDDPLPAILEAVNPEFRTQQAGGGAGGESFWQADYREVRADRVLYFCDHLRAGAYTFSYLARVRTAGQVAAPATKVEEMYRPERFGLSETTQLTSRAAE